MIKNNLVGAVLSVLSLVAMEVRAEERRAPGAPAPLVWRALDGSDTSSDIIPLSFPGGTSAAPRLRRKSTGKIILPRQLQPVLFFSDKVYSAQLDPMARGARPCIRLLFSGTARSDPEQGTVLNIDGAILGLRRDPVQPYADVCAATDYENGKRIWKPIGLTVPIDVQTERTRSAPLCVRENYAKKTWDLLVDDVVVARDLELFAGGTAPSITVRAGSRSGDQVLVKDISLSENPHKRMDSKIKSIDGRIDLAAEYQLGTAGVRRTQ